MTFIPLAGLTNFLLSAALGIFTFLKCPNRQVGRAYGLLNLCIALWSFFVFAALVMPTAEKAMPLWQGVAIGIVWINQAFLYFSLTFLDRVQRYRRLLWTVAALNVFFCILALNRSLFPFVTSKFGYGFWPVWTPWVSIYVAFWHAELFFAFWLLVRGLRNADGATRGQIQYMIAAFAIGYFGGGLAWLLWFDINFPPHTLILVSVYSAIVAYAILRHRLMDITIVIRKTLLYSLVSAALACVYGATILLLAQVLRGRYDSSSTFSSALAAIFITLLFNPLRLRIQRLVDRYFFREALDQALLREATSGFVHEIKRPLANISLPAELTLMDIQDLKHNRRSLSDVLPKMEQRLQYILHQTADAGSKIEAIREFSSSDGKPFEELELSQIIGRSLEAEGALLQRHGVKVEWKAGSGAIPIRGRAKQLEIVFSNLIKNAVEALDRREPSIQKIIWITAVKSGEKIIMRVKDSGPGINKENLPRLFEPYFTTKGVHGTGMGLYLCRQIIQTHGGTVTALSHSAGGAEFTITLPSI